MKLLHVLTFLAINGLVPYAFALDENGVDPSGLSTTQLRLQRGLQALYTFANTSGSVLDRSGNANPIDLSVGPNVSRSNGQLSVNAVTIVKSAPGTADRLVNACKTSNELTLEMWIENDTQGQLDIISRKILTLSNGFANGNFHISQDYDNGGVYTMGAKLGNNRREDDLIGGMDDPNPSTFDLSLRNNVLRSNRKQHVIFTIDQKGVARSYVSDENGIAIERVATGDFSGGFTNWATGMTLALGNEVDYESSSARKLNADDVDNAGTIRNNGSVASRDWLGTYHMVAIYCKALSRSEVLGSRAPGGLAPKIGLDLNVQVTPERTKALTLYRRLTGTTTPMYDPDLTTMENYIKSGDLVSAAHVATDKSGFYNRTLVDFATTMSNRDETPRAELNDFTAMVVGVARDDINAKELLTGNYLYVGDIRKTAVRRNMQEDILMSNNHYSDLSRLGYDLKDVLVKYPVNDNPANSVSKQKIMRGDGVLFDHPDPAGLITTRAFMSAHAIAGTNRRLVEYTFREFLCQPINMWADANAPDAMVGRDVDRYPGGYNPKFQTTCRSCHAVMDSMRPAFGRFNFSEDMNYVQHGYIDNDTFMEKNATGIATKMNRNENVFPGGYEMINTGWKNYAITGTNSAYFGWRDVANDPVDGSSFSSRPQGTNLGQFAGMISRADAFPRCMAKRVFKSVCKREVETFDENMINTEAEIFKSNGYNLRSLFERVAVTKECIGQ
ncbi:MAG: hypothetical protein KDD50_00510 [Bdellovibrionales bacterium]|nr:hypothetical protein [Bdellovibrionales bacterium]